jgi:hypothetical protein
MRIAPIKKGHKACGGFFAPRVPRVPMVYFDMQYSIPKTARCQGDFFILTCYSFKEVHLPDNLNGQNSYLRKMPEDHPRVTYGAGLFVRSY